MNSRPHQINQALRIRVIAQDGRLVRTQMHAAQARGANQVADTLGCKPRRRFLGFPRSIFKQRFSFLKFLESRSPLNAQRLVLDLTALLRRFHPIPQYSFVDSEVSGDFRYRPTRVDRQLYSFGLILGGELPACRSHGMINGTSRAARVS